MGTGVGGALADNPRTGEELRVRQGGAQQRALASSPARLTPSAPCVLPPRHAVTGPGWPNVQYRENPGKTT